MNLQQPMALIMHNFDIMKRKKEASVQINVGSEAERIIRFAFINNLRVNKDDAKSLGVTEKLPIVLSEALQEKMIYRGFSKKGEPELFIIKREFTLTDFGL